MSTPDEDPTPVGDGGGTGGGVSPGGGTGASGGTGGDQTPTPAATTGLITVLRQKVTLKVGGIVDVRGSALQTCSAETGRWQFELYIDGALVWNPGSDVRQVVVPLDGVKYCDPGDRWVELRWNAVPAVTLQGRYLKIRGFNNVAG